MKTLIIYAHPHHEGHANGFLSKLTSTLEKGNETYEVLDLYKENFNPVLSAEELFGGKNSGNDSQVLMYQDKVQNADNLVFIYPTWWQGPPAILKGFFDRVFAKGFAFNYSSKGLPEALLKGKKGVILNSAGAPRLLTRLLFGDMAVRSVKQTTLKFCGIQVKAFSIGNAVNLDKDMAAIEKCVKKAAAFLK